MAPASWPAHTSARQTAGRIRYSGSPPSSRTQPARSRTVTVAPLEAARPVLCDVEPHLLDARRQARLAPYRRAPRAKRQSTPPLRAQLPLRPRQDAERRRQLAGRCDQPATIRHALDLAVGTSGQCWRSPPAPALGDGGSDGIALAGDPRQVIADGDAVGARRGVAQVACERRAVGETVQPLEHAEPGAGVGGNLDQSHVLPRPRASRLTHLVAERQLAGGQPQQRQSAGRRAEPSPRARRLPVPLASMYATSPASRAGHLPQLIETQ